MGLASIFSNKIPLYRQRRRSPDAGPIAPGLKAMCAVDASDKPISRAGVELARFVNRRGLWVAFLPTGGEGASPWSGMILLDSSLQGLEQASPFGAGMVAHECTHVLQRDWMDPHFWPSGFLRINPFTRWFGDSTNYMELLSYIVGWTIEYDLASYKRHHTPVNSSEKKKLDRTLRAIENHLATLTDLDSANAIRYLIKLFYTSFFYTQNYRKELRVEDKRIPRGGWAHWLKRLGFSRKTIEHIQTIADQGKKEDVDKHEIDALAGASKLCGSAPAGRQLSLNRLPAPAIRRLSVEFSTHLGAAGLLLALYFLLGRTWPLNLALPERWSVLIQQALNWILWLVIGANVRGLFSLTPVFSNPESSHRLFKNRWGSILFVCFLTTLLILIPLALQIVVSLDLAGAFARLDFRQIPVGILESLAYVAGTFHELITKSSANLLCILWEGIIGPVLSLTGRSTKT